MSQFKYVFDEYMTKNFFYSHISKKKVIFFQEILFKDYKLSKIA